MPKGTYAEVITKVEEAEALLNEACGLRIELDRPNNPKGSRAYHHLLEIHGLISDWMEQNG